MEKFWHGRRDVICPASEIVWFDVELKLFLYIWGFEVRKEPLAGPLRHCVYGYAYGGREADVLFRTQRLGRKTWMAGWLVGFSIKYVELKIIKLY